MTSASDLPSITQKKNFFDRVTVHEDRLQLRACKHIADVRLCLILLSWKETHRSTIFCAQYHYFHAICTQRHYHVSTQMSYAVSLFITAITA